ncbi:MAG: hypothetical protein AB1846_03150 [Chloroflexota bacterium]
MSKATLQQLDEYLRFRHVVRNVYTFQFDPERIGKLVNDLQPVLAQTRQELLIFANFLEQIGTE